MVPINADDVLSDEHQFTVMNANYAEVSDFLQSCVDQNFIVNLVNNIIDEQNNATITSYYSTTLENATLFEQKFQDLSAEFSMRKLWNSHEYETNVNIIDINDTQFQTAETTAVVDLDQRELWGIYFPSFI